MSDKELVSRAQEGEVSAFEELVHRYDRKVLSIARSFANDPDDAYDIYQDVFLRVYRALPGFRFNQAPEGWVVFVLILAVLATILKSYYRHKDALRS